MYKTKKQFTQKYHNKIPVSPHKMQSLTSASFKYKIVSNNIMPLLATTKILTLSCPKLAHQHSCLLFHTAKDGT